MKFITANRIKTKEELLESLKEYKGLLKEYIFNYLESLIELDFSVIKENINYTDRKALSELEIYKNIAIYIFVIVYSRYFIKFIFKINIVYFISLIIFWIIIYSCHHMI